MLSLQMVFKSHKSPPHFHGKTAICQNLSTAHARIPSLFPETIIHSAWSSESSHILATMGASVLHHGLKPPKSPIFFVGSGTIIFTIHFGGFSHHLRKHPYIMWLDCFNFVSLILICVAVGQLQPLDTATPSATRWKKLRNFHHSWSHHVVQSWSAKSWGASTCLKHFHWIRSGILWGFLGRH